MNTELANTEICYDTSGKCNSSLPIQYIIKNTWIQFGPFSTTSIKPQELKPLNKLIWKYLTPDSLATSGIYSE